MKTLIFIALGGMTGALSRHGVNVLFARWFGHGFPFATMTVNILGSLAMGVVVGYSLSDTGISPYTRQFLVVGFLGAFTTFSAFSLDLVTLLQRGALLQAGFYLIGSILLSIIGLTLGFGIGKMMSAA